MKKDTPLKGVTRALSKAAARLRRSLVAVGVIVWVHAVLIAGLAIVMLGSTPEVRSLGAMMLGAVVLAFGVVLGAFIAYRLKANQPPVMGIDHLDHTLSGKPGRPADKSLDDEVWDSDLAEEVYGMLQDVEQPTASGIKMVATGDGGG